MTSESNNSSNNIVPGSVGGTGASSVRTAAQEPKREMTRELLLDVMPGLTDVQVSRFLIYYDRLITRNYRVNLTRITDPEDVAKKHFADSIIAASMIPEGASVVDVGTGAGFPGIPLKLIRPDIDLLLVDSLGKRILFLRELCNELGLDVPCVHARAEDAARQPELRGAFDVAVSRAVAPMNVLSELTTPFLKIGGCSLMYKGPNADEELAACTNALRELKCAADIVRFDTDWGSRNIVVFKKLGETPKKYPRNAGAVEKKPL